MTIMMKKISQILKESKIPQITGDLIRFNWISGKFEGKCALGVLACESGDPHLKLNKENNWVAYSTILKAYGIEDLAIYPYLDINNSNYPEPWNFKIESNLSGIIMRLNDSYDLTLKEIGEFLEVTFNL